MATIVDPGGTPSPVYNKSGATVQSITGNTSTAPVIGHFSVLDIVLFTSVIGLHGNYVYLPVGADIGDLVEIHSVGSTDPEVFPSSGDTINGLSASAGIANGQFRKVSSTDWRSNA